MKETIQAMLASGKGLLAADESFPTIKKRFDALGISSTEQTRRDYRSLLFAAPELSRFIGGVILFDETARQANAEGKPLIKLLSEQGIVPGVKVDRGTVELAGFPKEKITEGLDGLRDRLKEYYTLGARFTKWRAVISIGEGQPSAGALTANAHALARFAALTQEEKLVPIVEPEVLMNGDHSIEQCEEVTTRTLRAVFAALAEQRVNFETMILKTGMVLSGDKASRQADDAEIARATLRCFRRSVPAAVPGIVFLSGGQNPEEATRRLDAICAIKPTPWKLSFSYGRALQDEALQTWRGSAENTKAAQEKLHARAQKVSSALRD